jgi:TrpR-related protein YerC/YecD
MGTAENFFRELCGAFLAVADVAGMENFFRDLCTPMEIASMAERWRVCRLLHGTDLSYREIHRLTGVSLVTIGRVARFLRNEPHGGYHAVLGKLKDNATPTNGRKRTEK